MKVAIVHDWLTGLRGGEKCLEWACRRFPDARLYTLLHVRGAAGPTIERLQIQTSFLQRVPGVARHYRYLLPLMPRAIESFRLPPDLDLVLSFSHAVAKGVRVPPGVPHVCYCFTPMRYAWDLREAYFGASSPGAAQLSSTLDGATGARGPDADAGSRVARFPRRILQGLGDRVRNRLLDRVRDWDRAASGRVTHYIAISQTIAERIRRCYDRPSRVVYPPVDVDFYTPAPQPPGGRRPPREDFYLCVSALAPYKRIDLAIQACRQLGRRLIVIGAGPEAEKLRRLRAPGIELLGWQEDAVIRDHLRRCRALLFPGLEDFGIVPVEAQACGAPVIAYGQGGARETVTPPSWRGPGSGLFFEQPCAASLASAMQELEARPELVSPDVARANALQFRRLRFESEMAASLDDVLSGMDEVNFAAGRGRPTAAPSLANQGEPARAA